jgi:protein-ribulosamine 3-kinase
LLELLLNASLRHALRIDSAEAACGGCIHECYRVSIGGESRFLKLNEKRFADAFAAEADGLAALRSAGLRAPDPLAQGVAHAQAYLLLEYLDLEHRGDFAALGRMLAQAHRKPGPRFGWQRDNYIGSTPQKNDWCDDWAEFWRERRLRAQIELASSRGFDLETPSLHLLQNHHPQPSLLHGDLWSGNAGFTSEGPVVFDPAVYYGDREADLAMTELFGGFPREFYKAYNDVFPLPDGYERRKHLYNLYHLLNHLNLFGGGYLGQVKATLRLLRL